MQRQSVNLRSAKQLQLWDRGKKNAFVACKIFLCLMETITPFLSREWKELLRQPLTTLLEYMILSLQSGYHFTVIHLKKKYQNAIRCETCPRASRLQGSLSCEWEIQRKVLIPSPSKPLTSLIFTKLNILSKNINNFIFSFS